MKILLISLNYAPELAGIGRFNGEMCDWLSERGHKVKVIAAPPYYPEWRVYPGYSGSRYAGQRLGGVGVIRCPIYIPAKVTSLRRLLHLMSFGLSSAPILLWQALTWRPEIVMVTEPPLAAAPMAILAAALCGGRTALHVQDLEVDAAFGLGMLKSRILRRAILGIERRLMQRFTIVSTISARMVDRLLSKGVPRQRTALVPNWADIAVFSASEASARWRRKVAIGAGELILLYSGSMGMKQGLETLVEVARSLRHRADLRFVFCGDGVGREGLESAARDLANVTFLALQPAGDLAAMLQAADIHLLPQRAGAADLVMPSKLGNILASGRPVIAGAVPGTQLYAVVDGCGIAVPPEDAQALAKAIERLAADPGMRHALGEKARNEAFSHWNRQTILENFETLLLGDRPSAAKPRPPLDHSGRSATQTD